MTADYQDAIRCLRENLSLLTDAKGTISPENKIFWNLSNALIVVCDGLRHLEEKQQSQ